MLVVALLEAPTPSEPTDRVLALHLDIAGAEAHLVGLESLGISPTAIGDELQAEGVRLFA